MVSLLPRKEDILLRDESESSPFASLEGSRLLNMSLDAPRESVELEFPLRDLLQMLLDPLPRILSRRLPELPIPLEMPPVLDEPDVLNRGWTSTLAPPLSREMLGMLALADEDEL